jgi:Uma2 family endonuclease
MSLSRDHRHIELIDGILHDMSPGGGRHGAAIMILASRMCTYAQQHALGLVFGSETGYRLDATNCFAPDISFVSTERLSNLLPDPDKYLQGAPDLAVEVLSPNDSWAQSERKVRLYFKYGTRLAWIIDPKARILRIYRTSQDFEVLPIDASLSGEIVLPGFIIPLLDVFPI